jgi:hypothetical protein
MVHTVLMWVLVLAFGPAAVAQHVHPAPASATTAVATSSLSAVEVQQLLDGDGMGYAKAVYRGQSQPNVPAVTSAYIRPSKTDFNVVPQLRLNQIDCWNSAKE